MESSDNNNPTLAAIREFREETGYDLTHAAAQIAATPFRDGRNAYWGVYFRVLPELFTSIFLQVTVNLNAAQSAAQWVQHNYVGREPGNSRAYQSLLQSFTRNRRRAEARGRALALTQGILAPVGWWRPAAWEQFKTQLPQWMNLQLEHWQEQAQESAITTEHTRRRI
jgi:hypothetical protein